MFAGTSLQSAHLFRQQQTCVNMLCLRMQHIQLTSDCCMMVKRVLTQESIV